MLSAVGFSRSDLFKGLLLGVACTTTLPALADNDSDLLTRSTLTGDWGGLRHQMDEQGIKFTGDYSGEMAYNADGGLHRSARYSQNIKLGVQFDLSKLYGVDNAGKVQLTINDRRGNSASEDLVGNRLPIQENYGGLYTRLTELSYERSLFPVIDQIIRHPYARVIDIGCAEGYYAVGLARAMRATLVHAHDIDDRAQTACRSLAAANGCLDRVIIGGRFSVADFAICTQAETVVICDIEGAEAELLDPVRAPGLRAADILVEAHDTLRHGLSHLLVERFKATHHVRVIGRKLDDSGLPDWMEALSDLDRLVALWEWRGGPTPWLWMVKK